LQQHKKKYIYIYDNKGTEIHCLKKHLVVNKLQYLPYHFLLLSVGETGILRYQDISTGQLIIELKTKLGPCNTFAQNPYNAITLLGHYNGTVTMWSPNITTPLVKILCHRAPVKSIAVDNRGLYMVTTALDGQMKVWDVRNYKELHSYYTPIPATSIAISQKDILAVSWGTHVQLWKDAFTTKATSPYMSHTVKGAQIHDISYCPYEDVLGIGHAKGFSSIIVPGSGEPNYDYFEANLFETNKQRRETEVHSLLEKIQPEMITLTPGVIGKMDQASAEVLAKEKKRRRSIY